MKKLIAVAIVIPLLAGCGYQVFTYAQPCIGEPDDVCVAVMGKAGPLTSDRQLAELAARGVRSACEKIPMAPEPQVDLRTALGTANAVYDFVEFLLRRLEKKEISLPSKPCAEVLAESRR